MNGDTYMLIIDGLPWKSLCRFTCVSTQWRELISLTQLNHSNAKILEQSRPPRLLLLDTRWAACTLSASFLSIDCSNADSYTVKPTPCLNKFSSFLQSEGKSLDFLPCKGELICLDDSSRTSFYVCNPTTEKFVRLPNPSPSVDGPKLHNAFGYVPSTNEFKVAHFYKSPRDFSRGNTIRCEIFTILDGKDVESCSWVTIEDSCPSTIISQTDGVLVNGAFYWLSSKEDERYYSYPVRPPSVISLDLVTKKFLIKSLPTGIVEMEQYELEGLYCIADGLSDVDRLLIWSLKYREHDGNNNINESDWEKRYTICFRGVGTMMLNPLYVWNGEIVLFDKLGTRDRHGELRRDRYFYNIETGKYRTLSIQDSFGKDTGFYINGSFSLISSK